MSRWALVPLWGLFVIVAWQALIAGYPVLAPATAAALAAIVLAPIVQGLARFRIPRPVTSFLLCAALLGGLSGGLTLLAEEASDWTERAPELLAKVEERLRVGSDGATAGISKASEQLEAIGEIARGEADDNTVTVEMRSPGVMERLLSTTPRVLGMLGLFIFLVFFFLTGGEDLVRRITALAQRAGRRTLPISSLIDLRRSLSRVLATVTVINCTLGLLTWLVLSALGVPEAALLGALAAMMNFMPYVGPTITAAVIGMVSIGTFPTLLEALYPVGLFITLTTLEGQLITPTLLSRELKLNALLVFGSVVALGWAWGWLGAILAVPVLAVGTIVARSFRESDRSHGEESAKETADEDPETADELAGNAAAG